MKIDHKSSVPLYKQIENIIRNLIESGKFDNGEFLPKETDLAKKWGVSRNTVRQGITQLAREGLIERTPGKGTIVSDKKLTTNLSEWHSFSEEMFDRGINLNNYFIQSEFVNISDDVAKQLHLEEEKKVLKLERLRGDENNPFVYFISWFHPRIGFTGKENFELPLYSILEDKFSVYPFYSIEKLRAVLPGKEIANYLQLKKSKPVLLRKRLVLDTKKQPIEYNIGYYRSDELSLSINLKRPEF